MHGYRKAVLAMWTTKGLQNFYSPCVEKCLSAVREQAEEASRKG